MTKNLSYITLGTLVFFLSSCIENQVFCPSPDVNLDLTKANRKILFIGVDGLRSDVMTSATSPFLYDLSLRNTTYFNNQHLAEEPTWSGSNWSSILTGVHVNKHQVFKSDFSNHNFQNYPHFFDYIESSNCGAKTASIVNWPPINQHIVSDKIDYAPKIEVTDYKIYTIAMNMLINRDPLNPDFLFVYFHDTDLMGHAHGFSSSVDEYTNTITKTDNYIKELVSVIEKRRSEGEDWMIIITSDHGGEGHLHSDFSNEHIKNTVLYINNPNVQFNHEHKSTQVDIAPTALDFAGIKSPDFDNKTDGLSIIK